MKLFGKKDEGKTILKMMTEINNGYYMWDGRMYQSDIIRACIEPQAKALGKIVAKHVRETIVDGYKKIEVNPMVHIRFLLEEPNEYMSFQVMIEKVSNQLALNGNAFILILRNSDGIPLGAYPITCNSVEAKYDNSILYLKFYLQNGRNMTFPYSDVIHIRGSFYDNELFGDNPADALKSTMNVVSVTDQGIVNAIKNSGIIKWLLKFTNSMRPEDLKTHAQEFADNYLSMSSSSVGVAAVDSKADIIRVESKEYVPNAAQMDKSTQRIFNFFHTNEKIVNSTYTEDEWVAYYEAIIEPIALQMANEFTRKIFSRTERSFGNKIVFESSNLTYASMATKLNLVQFVDRGIMTPNEVRYLMNMVPIDGGDVALLRKDTGTLTGEGGE